MKKHHEKLLIAALAGLVIVSGALFAIQPATASMTLAAKAQQQSTIDLDALSLHAWAEQTVAMDSDVAEAPCFINVASCPLAQQVAENTI